MAGEMEIVDVQAGENGNSNGVGSAQLLGRRQSSSTWWQSKGPVPADHDNAVINHNWFPKGFLFGSGCAAYQVEGGAMQGGRGISVWDDFALTQPWRIEDGSNGNVAADMYNRYKEDIKMMKQMGFNSFRFSISWPRILPAGRISGGVNRQGIDYYNSVIDTVLEYDMTPFVTIFHWDLPANLEKEYGGFLSKKIRHDYLEFANVCFWEFGDRVKHWTTFNEPEIYALQGYVTGSFPPGRVVPFPSAAAAATTPTLAADRSAATTTTLAAARSATTARLNFASTRTGKIPTAVKPSAAADVFPDPPAAEPSEVYKVGTNLLLAHAEAVHLYRTKFQEAQKGEVGIVLVTSYFLPYDEHSEADRAACERARDFLLGWFLEPLMSGQYPKSMKERVPPENLIRFSKRERELLKGSIDFLGMNYYTYQYIQDAPNLSGEGYLADMKLIYQNTSINNETLPFSVPRGIYELLVHLNNYHQTLKQLYISENGYHTETDFKKTAKMVCENDQDRIKYHQDHLANLLKAMKEVNYEVKGYFVWAWCDTYEWNSGYTMRFGLNYVDFTNNCARYPKDSAAWFARFLHSHVQPPEYFHPSWIPATPLPEKRVAEEDMEITLKKGSKVVVGYN